MNISFSGVNTFDEMLNPESKKTTCAKSLHCSTEKTSKKISTFPIMAFKKLGARITDYGDGSFKITFRNMHQASLKTFSEDNIEKILLECEGEECDIMNQASKPMWNITKISGNSFKVERA